jgi:hypothetical protein
MRLIGTVAGVCVIATLLAACSGSKAQPTSTTGTSGGNSGGTSAPSSDSSSPTDVVNGGTFTMSMSADPGNLDPQGSATSNTFQMTQFAYDNLLSESADGKIESGIATKWQVAGTKVTLTLHKGITCSDGAPFTAADAVANISYVADPKNKSPFLGVYLPGGAKASAGAAAGTITITLAQPGQGDEGLLPARRCRHGRRSAPRRQACHQGHVARLLSRRQHRASEPVPVAHRDWTAVGVVHDPVQRCCPGERSSRQARKVVRAQPTRRTRELPVAVVPVL